MKIQILEDKVNFLRKDQIKSGQIVKIIDSDIHSVSWNGQFLIKVENGHFVPLSVPYGDELHGSFQKFDNCKFILIPRGTILKVEV